MVTLFGFSLAGMQGCSFWVLFLFNFAFLVFKKCKKCKKCKKMQKNTKKMQKNLLISKKSCNFAPSFKNERHDNPIRKPKTTNKMNKIYFTQSFGEIKLTTAEINRNFRIKVNGIANGQYVSKLVGIRGLLEILGGSWQKLVKMVLRAFNCLNDKCACKIYGGAKVTFYAK